MSSIIANNEKENKFYLRLDGKEAYLKYKIIKESDSIDMLSIYVPKEFRGKDIGESIAKEALGYADKNNLKVIATCPFIRTFVRRHREYRRLLV